MPTLHIVEDRIQGKKYQLQLPWKRGSFLTNVLYAEYADQTLIMKPEGPDGAYIGKIGNTTIIDEGNLRTLEQGLMDIADVTVRNKARQKAYHTALAWYTDPTSALFRNPMRVSTANYVALGVATGIF